MVQCPAMMVYLGQLNWSLRVLLKVARVTRWLFQSNDSPTSHCPSFGASRNPRSLISLDYQAKGKPSKGSTCVLFQFLLQDRMVRNSRSPTSSPWKVWHPCLVKMLQGQHPHLRRLSLMIFMKALPGIVDLSHFLGAPHPSHGPPTYMMVGGPFCQDLTKLIMNSVDEDLLHPGRWRVYGEPQRRC